MLGTYDDIRPDLKFWMEWFVRNQPMIKWLEIRPIQLGSRLPITDDCYGTVTDVVYLAGGNDINGFNFDGRGNTTTIAQHCHQRSPDKVDVGDLVVRYNGYGFSPYDSVHVSMVYDISDVNDPICMSHGWSGEPAFGRRSADTRPYLIFTYPKNSRFPKPKPPVHIPPDKGKPTQHELTANNLVLLKNPAQARVALTNGWRLWYYSEGHTPNAFCPVIGGKPSPGAQYANIAWRSKAV